MPPVRGPFSPDVVLGGGPGRMPPPTAGDELLEGGLEGKVGELLGEGPDSDKSLKDGIGGGT
jgi:hypothetical protein